MHPILVLAPALALVLGPRLWVRHVLAKHNRRDIASARSAGELARELLDKNRLQTVKVESTDIGDHYDPVVKSVRLARDNIDRRTLTALTTAAHEVAHALQHATAYGPFIWRMRLVKVAQRAGEAGSVLFLAVPLSVIFSRDNSLPPILVGSAAVAMLGTSVFAQLAALPSELDASFGRALPMLRDGYISEQQGKAVRRILWACSLTYIASSLVGALHIWPWVRHVPMALSVMPSGARSSPKAPAPALPDKATSKALLPRSRVQTDCRRGNTSLLATLIRPIGKPLIRLWLLAAE
jgi:Zn-dependent membrane protease YugP